MIDEFPAYVQVIGEFLVYCTSWLMIFQYIVQVSWWFPRTCTSCWWFPSILYKSVDGIPSICKSCWWFLSHVQVICDCSACVQVGKWFPSMCTSCWWFPSIIVKWVEDFPTYLQVSWFYFPVDIISFEKIVFYILVNVLLMYDRYLICSSLVLGWKWISLYIEMMFYF